MTSFDDVMTNFSWTFVSSVLINCSHLDRSEEHSYHWKLLLTSLLTISISLDFGKITFSLWLRFASSLFFFFFFCVIIGFFTFISLCRVQLFLETFVTSHIGVLYRNASAHKILKVKVKGQGHFVVNHGGRRNTNFLSNFDRIVSKLHGNLVYGQALSWLVFGGDRPWPSWLALEVENYWPQGQILKS